MKNLFRFNLSFDREIVTITIVSTLLIMLDSYHNFTGYKALDRVFIYLVIPILVIIFLTRQPLKAYGFSWGEWRVGLAFTGLFIMIGAPILWGVTNGNPAMIEFYAEQYSPALPLITFLDLIGWEFFFRGWILFGYQKKFGDHAVWLQAVPFALAHIGKPEAETISTIFGGFLFGLVAWRTKSFVYPFLIHWFINTFVVWVAANG
ncbi:MAG: CPBP family intramembrane metalloprotease [Chloroflexota bacterium]